MPPAFFFGPCAGSLHGSDAHAFRGGTPRHGLRALIIGMASPAAASSSVSRWSRPAPTTSTSPARTAALARMMAMNEEQDGEVSRRFAPPFLKDGDLVVSHAANILLYLGGRLGLAPEGRSRTDRRHTGCSSPSPISSAEIHDAHHPLGVSLYYRRPEGRGAPARRELPSRRTPAEIPRLLRKAPRRRTAQGQVHALGDALTYVDLSLFHLLEGLRYAFPNAMTGGRAGLSAAPRAQRPGPRTAADQGLPCLRAPACLSTRKVFSAIIRSLTDPLADPLQLDVRHGVSAHRQSIRRSCRKPRRRPLALVAAQAKQAQYPWVKKGG